MSSRHCRDPAWRTRICHDSITDPPRKRHRVLVEWEYVCAPVRCRWLFRRGALTCYAQAAKVVKQAQRFSLTNVQQVCFQLRMHIPSLDVFRLLPCQYFVSFVVFPRTGSIVMWRYRIVLDFDCCDHLASIAGEMRCVTACRRGDPSRAAGVAQESRRRDAPRCPDKKRTAGSNRRRL